MKVIVDRNGRYAGRTQGAVGYLVGRCAGVVIVLTFLIGFFIWPYLALQEPDGRESPTGWPAEGLWLMFLGWVFYLLGRRAHRVAQRRKDAEQAQVAAQAAAARVQAPAAPGPRDWIQDDGARLI
jgi:hypothetical protein